MDSKIDVYSITKDEIRLLNLEITKMRYEMHKMQENGRYYFMDLNIDSLPYEELKQEYNVMLQCINNK